METLSPKADMLILDRNNRYLDNISTEHRPIIFSQTDAVKLDNCILESCEDVFEVPKEEMIKGAKNEAEVYARIGTAEVFRLLTSYSSWEIGQRLGVAESSVNGYLAKSKQMLREDIFYSAFVLTSVIKAFGSFYPSAQFPIDTERIIKLAIRPNSTLPEFLAV